MKKLLLTSLALLILSSPLIAAEKAGTISRDATLYAKPFKDADAIAALPAATAILILNRKGGWYEIKASDKQGWVRLTRVRLNRKGGTNEEDSSGVGELLSGLATGRDKTTQDTTATAVKGLSEEELLNAEPDEEALSKLDNFAASGEASDDSGLQTRQIDFQPTDNKPDAPATAPPAPKTSYEEDE